MSLRPPLHVSTFHPRTVVSMFGRLCHLFVHALSSLQVANAQCMTLRSLAPCLRAAREKHRFAAGKNIGTEKITFGSRKKMLCSGKKVSPQREKHQQKMPLRRRKNSKQKKKVKTPCSSTKAPLQQKKCILRQRERTVRGRKKPVRGKKKTGRGRKKTSSRESPALQPKKLPQRKKHISETGKSSSPMPRRSMIRSLVRRGVQKRRQLTPTPPPVATVPHRQIVLTLSRRSLESQTIQGQNSS